MTAENKLTPMPFEDPLLDKLALACRILGTEGHDDLNLGHLSVRKSEQPDIMLMKGRGRRLSEIQADDLVAIDFNYRKIAGARDTHSEMPIHVEIYRHRPDVHCVVHTHPMYATAFSSTGQRLMPINNESVLFAKPLPYFDKVTDLIVTPELGKALAKTLGREKAVFMKNHGIVVVGATIEEATVRTYLLEKAVKTLFVAKVLGDPAWTDESEAQQKVQKIFTPPKIKSMWESLARRLEKREAPLRILKLLEEKMMAS